MPGSAPPELLGLFPDDPQGSACGEGQLACLQAGAASALSFNFSFSGGGFPTDPATVTGSVDGLIDNLNNQTTGLTVTITSATNGPSGTVFTDANYISGEGFDVASGQVTGVNIFYMFENLRLSLQNQGGILPPFYDDFAEDFINEGDNSSPANSLVFTPSDPAPPALQPGAGAGVRAMETRPMRIASVNIFAQGLYELNHQWLHTTMLSMRESDGSLVMPLLGRITPPSAPIRRSPAGCDRP